MNLGKQSTPSVNQSSLFCVRKRIDSKRRMQRFSVVPQVNGFHMRSLLGSVLRMGEIFIF